MIEIKLKPLSMGRIWGQTKSGKRFLTNEGRAYKKAVAMHCLSLGVLRNYHGAIAADLEFHGPWLTKRGTISKSAGDIDNFTKLIFDSLCEAYGFDDSQIMEVHLRKVIADDWIIRLDLKPTSLKNFFPIPD